MFELIQGPRPRAVAFAVALALGLSGCGGGGGGSAQSSPTPPSVPPATGTGVFTGGDINVDAGQTLVLSYNIGGSIDLNKVGAGTLVLTGNNNYTGNTEIDDGTLQIGSGGTAGMIRGRVVDDSFLVFDRSDVALFQGTVTGTGSLEQAGTGTLILAGDNTYTGGTTISRGTLQIGYVGSTGSIIGDVKDNGALVFARFDDVTFKGIVSGSGTLEQTGHGTLTLLGANTYTGGTIISDGTLQLGNGGTSGSIVGNVLDNGTLVFNRSGDWSYGGVVSGSGVVVKLGNGMLVIANANTHTGGTTVEAGTLRIVAGGSLASGVVVSSNATLEIEKGATVSGEANLSQGGKLDNAGTLGSLVDYTAVSGDGVTVVNHDGGLIQSEYSQAGLDVSAVVLGPNSTLINEAGSTIRGYGGVSTTGSVINAGGTIIGVGLDGISGASVVNNTDGGRVLAGTGQSVHSIIAMGVKTDATNAIVNNVGGSTIQGILDGVSLFDGGVVTNDGGSSITGHTGVGIVSNSGATGLVKNTGGSTIVGDQAGIVLGFGGTVINGAGSTLGTTATPSADCSVTLACAIYVPVYNAFGDYGSDGRLTLTNAGTINGNVQTDPGAINSITLLAGGSIHGDLSIGSNTQSTLTLDGASGTTQMYTLAVTGTTTFGGELVKNGDGTWIVDSGDLQRVTETSINAGSLQATHMLAGDVAVHASGTLDAVPGVAGGLSNAGTVAVHGGDSAVGGDYTQASTGTLAVSLGSRLDVMGRATLSGGTLKVTGADTGYVSNAHTNVLTAQGGVSGTIARLVKDTGVVFTATTINYDNNNVWLDTTGLDVTTAAAGNGVHYTRASMNSAQRVQGAFAQLDDKIARGHVSAVSNEFVQAAGQFQQAPTLQAAQASLQSLSGELHAASAAITFQAIDASSRALSDHFDQLLDKGASYGMWTHDLNVGGDMARSGFNSVGFQLNGWLVGNDRKIGRTGVAGYAFGQSRNQQRLSQSYDHDNGRSTEGMFYAGWLNGNWYTQGRVGFGTIQQDVNRRILLGETAQGVGTRYTGNYSVAYQESGLHFGRGSSHITPFVNVQYARIARDGFAEQGAGGFGLQSDAQTLDRLQAGVGIRAARHWNMGGDRALDLDVRAQWQRTLASHGDAFDASFVGMQNWQPLLGVGLSRYSGLLGVGLDATLSRRATLKFSYDYETGQRDRAQTWSTHLNVAF